MDISAFSFEGQKIKYRASDPTKVIFQVSIDVYK